MGRLVGHSGPLVGHLVGHDCFRGPANQKDQSGGCRSSNNIILFSLNKDASRMSLSPRLPRETWWPTGWPTRRPTMAHYTAHYGPLDGPPDGSHLFRICKIRLAAINSLVVKLRPLTIHTSPVRFPLAPGTHRTSSFQLKNVLQYCVLSSPAGKTRDSTACLLFRPRKEMALRAHLTRA